MTSIDTLKELLTFRYATKSFDPTQKLPEAEKQALLTSLPLAPSSFGMQLWKFFIIEDSAKREELKAVSWNQGQVTDSDFHIVFAVETGFDEARVDKWMKCLSDTTGAPIDGPGLTGYKGAIMGFTSTWSDEQKVQWAKLQAYIALGQFMTSAALLKVDTCPMEGIDAAAYDAILGLNEKGYTTAVACSVGYRSADDKHAGDAKARFSYEEMVEVI